MQKNRAPSGTIKSGKVSFYVHFMRVPGVEKTVPGVQKKVLGVLKKVLVVF